MFTSKKWRKQWNVDLSRTLQQQANTHHILKYFKSSSFRGFVIRPLAAASFSFIAEIILPRELRTVFLSFCVFWKLFRLNIEQKFLFLDLFLLKDSSFCCTQVGRSVLMWNLNCFCILIALLYPISLLVFFHFLFSSLSSLLISCREICSIQIGIDRLYRVVSFGGHLKLQALYSIPTFAFSLVDSLALFFL